VEFRSSNVLLAVSLAVVTMTFLLATVAIVVSDSKPVAPNPARSWPENTQWGTRLILENASTFEDAWFGVGSMFYYQMVDGFDMYLGLIENGQDYYAIGKPLRLGPQDYTWYVIMEGGTVTKGGTLRLELENSTNEFIPPEFSVVLENRTNNLFVNLRVENGQIDLSGQPVGIVFATLYIDNFAPTVGVSVSPANVDRVRGGAIDYTITVTSLADNSENLDLLAPSSFAYLLSASDNLGWNLELADNMLDNILPGNSKTTTLTVTVPENAEFGSQDNITISAISRTDPWVGDNVSCMAVAANLVAGHYLLGFTGLGENGTLNNLFNDLTYLSDYYVYWWNAPGGPYNLQDSSAPLKDNLGYWILLNQDVWLGPNGTPPISDNVHLFAGWNLVNFPTTNENTTPSKVFAGLTYLTDYMIYAWNPPSGPYVLQNASAALDDNIGYWIWIDRDIAITVRPVTQPSEERLILALENVIYSGTRGYPRFSVTNLTSRTLTFSDTSLGLRITDRFGDFPMNYFVYTPMITSIGVGEAKETLALLDYGYYTAFSVSNEGVVSNSVNFGIYISVP
jgi:hypothetical protein